MRTLALSIIALLTLTWPAFAQPKLGEPAPTFTATDIQGKAQSLDAHKGKVVVLEWNNPGCPFVKKFYDSGEMQRLQKSATDGGAVWLTINSGAQGKQGAMTTAEAQKQVADWKSASTAYILDPKGEIGKAYGAKTTPHMYVIDASGKLAYMGAIDDKPSTDPKDIAGAKNYVTAALDAVKAGKPVQTASTEAYGCAVKYAD